MNIPHFSPYLSLSLSLSFSLAHTQGSSVGKKGVRVHFATVLLPKKFYCKRLLMDHFFRNRTESGAPTPPAVFRCCTTFVLLHRFFLFVSHSGHPSTLFKTLDSLTAAMKTMINRSSACPPAPESPFLEKDFSSLRITFLRQLPNDIFLGTERIRNGLQKGSLCCLGIF